MAYSKPLNLIEVREKLRKSKTSLNDYIISAATLSLSQIAVSVDKVHVSIPFTLKDFPTSIKSLNVGNDFALLPVYLEFPKDRSLNSF